MPGKPGPSEVRPLRSVQFRSIGSIVSLVRAVSTSDFMVEAMRPGLLTSVTSPLNLRRLGLWKRLCVFLSYSTSLA